ncbi:MAG: tpl protein [Eggerthellaceae bacterium]|nr:tpl protein [Eggerthellaceae bacterium]
METRRGREIGELVRDIYEVDSAELGKKEGKRPVLREANHKDLEKFEFAQSKAREALPIFKRIAADECPDMRPVAVEYMLEGNKAVFYFEAENRVDFRQLIKKLSAEFHVKIDMRQIGVREEARLLGDYGSCGHGLCCKLMHGDFKPVSIRMAKFQDISLNTEKISGACGRLMCCLRYEEEVYKDFKAKAPKLKSKVDTPEGPALVTGYEVPKGVVLVKPECQEKNFRIPLKKMKMKNECDRRPSLVTKAAWDDATKQKDIEIGIEVLISTSQFTGSDEVVDAGRVCARGGYYGKFSPSNIDFPAKNNRTSNKLRRRRRCSGSGGERSNSNRRSGGRQKMDLHSRCRQSRMPARLEHEFNAKRRRRSRKVETSSQRPGQNSSELENRGLGTI